MQTFYKSILILVLITMYSCEEVIDVTVPEEASRLVVEASLDWQKGTAGNNQTIKLSQSIPYFENQEDNEVTGALVTVINNSSNIEYIFTDQENGTYTVSNFEPVINDTYTLEVVYNNETYIATEILTSVPSIKRIEQSLEGGFDEDVLDVSVIFDDPVNEENFYFFKFKEDVDLLPEIEYASDEFVNGNEIDWFFEKERDDEDDQVEFNSGDTVEMWFYGISEQYYNYIALLTEQYYSGGDPFSAIPTKLKGNCINIDNPDNYAYGYFRLTEFEKRTYIFE